MHTITINIKDSVLDKVVYFLQNLPKQDVEIISDTIVKDENLIEDDFISYLVHNPVDISNETAFLSRDEAHER